jgi:hypothetical protein
MIDKYHDFKKRVVNKKVSPKCLGSAFENQSEKQPQWGECPATVLAPIHYLLLN